MIDSVKNRCGLGLRLILIVMLFLNVFEPLTAQTNKDYILANTNVEALSELASRLAEEYRVKHERALVIAAERGWPLYGLQYIDERGLPVYYTVYNADASNMTQTTQLRNEFGLQGFGMVIGEWDGGHVRWTHQDLVGRVVIWDGPLDVESHATHVAGTLIGNGSGNLSAMGMAPQATLRSYDWNNDISEIIVAGISGVLISNHSYGTVAGWEKEDGLVCSGFAKKWTWHGGSNEFNQLGDDPSFGQYSSKARSIDLACIDAPFLLPVNASGNDYNDQPFDGPCSDDVRYIIEYDEDNEAVYSDWVSYNEDIHPGGDGTHTSSIPTWGNAKNILTVGNLQDNQVINGSSSRGKADDGRVKPDICGNGTDVMSTEVASDNAYGVETGTSMAAPNVAGSLLLLQQLYEEKNGHNGIYMRSATLKGLAIHTATDLGNPGPDYTYGWGLLNAQKAGVIINRDSYGLDHKIIEENNPNGYAFTFLKDGPIRVTLCYTDKAGTATFANNDATPKLVNDLDLTLVKTGGPTYFPYKLNPNNPSAYATTDDNDLDNVEQIYLNNASDGEYTVYVNVEGSLTDSQPFSLIISGVSDGCGGSDLDLGNNTVEPDIYYGDNIFCEGTVEAGTEVRFVAGTSVFLKQDGGSGFHAESGSNFKAVALPCE